MFSDCHGHKLETNDKKKFTNNLKLNGVNV